MESVKIDSSNALVSALDDNSRKCLSVRQFSYKNYEIVHIVINLDQITEVPNPM